MIELLTNYSLGEIFIFLVLAAITLKEVATFLDWANDKARKRVKKEQQPQTISQKLNTAIQQQDQQIVSLKDDVKNIQDSIKNLNDKIEMLISSDRDSIKAWITAQHHYFMEKGTIDYYSFDCISRRYAHYKEQGGNTFIDDIMEDINNLPKTGDKKGIHNI